MRPSLRFLILSRDGFRCRYCGRSADDGTILHVDHLHPKSKGGENVESNLVTACRDCNLGKGKLVLRPVPTRRRVPRTPSVAPAIVDPDDFWEVGDHCVTPLKIAAIGQQLGIRSYSQAHRFVKTHGDPRKMPPLRQTDYNWTRVVAEDPYHARALVNSLGRVLAGEDTTTFLYIDTEPA